MHWLLDQIDETTSYIAGGLGMLQSTQLDSVLSLVMGVGSFVLLVARLYIDVPRAIDAWKRRRSRKQEEADE